jgi:hypothetical protein
LEVYLLHHLHELPDGSEEIKLLGVYSSQERAEEAKRQALVLPGFCDLPQGFTIDRNQVDGSADWPEGFHTVTDSTGTFDLPYWFRPNLE